MSWEEYFSSLPNTLSTFIWITEVFDKVSVLALNSLLKWLIRKIKIKKLSRLLKIGDGPHCRTRNPGDLDPTPPTLHIPTHLHPLDLDPTPPPGSCVLQWGASGETGQSLPHYCHMKVEIQYFHWHTYRSGAVLGVPLEVLTTPFRPTLSKEKWQLLN